MKNDPALAKHWFVWGLTLAGLAMIRHGKAQLEKQPGSTSGHSNGDQQDGVDLESIATACDGLARVIVPLIRTLHAGPGAL